MHDALPLTSLVLLLLPSSTLAAPQCEFQKLLTNDAVCGDNLGQSSTFAGPTLTVGAQTDENGMGNVGSVYLYDLVLGTWELTDKLLASDPTLGGDFGNAISGDGDRLAIACLGATGGGAVYIFDRIQGTWTETAKLRPSGVGSHDSFATDVSLDGDVLLVGAPNAVGPFPRGAAWILEWDGSSWSPGQELTASDGQPSDVFGISVSVSGTTAVIGARGDDGASFNEGSAYVFEKLGSTWVEVAKLTASDAVDGAWFGQDVAIDGDTIVVGAPGHRPGEPIFGSVYVFERNTDGTWGPTETFSFTSSDPEDNIKFGIHLAIDGDRFIATSHGDEGGATTGNVQVFERDGPGWNRIATLVHSDASHSDLFGFSNAISGNLVLVGALGNDDVDPDDIGCNSGSAYVFEFPDNTSLYGFGEGCPCGNDDPDRGCVNSRGLGAALAPCGTTSVAADDLILRAAFLPESQFGIAFMGGIQTSVPFGDGQRRAGAGGVGIHRYLPILSSGPGGTISLGPGLVAHSQSFPADGHIDPGETWNFQFWYRDPMGSPCGARFNLTNAVAATFVP